MHELETLLAQPQTLTVAGQTVPLLPLKVGQLPAFLRVLLPLWQPLRQESPDWLGLLSEHGEAVLTALAIASGQPRSWIDSLTADEAILLAARLLQLNTDFFTRKVVPALDQLFRPEGGPTPSGRTPSSN